MTFFEIVAKTMSSFLPRNKSANKIIEIFKPVYSETLEYRTNYSSIET